jgi:hypothetical protein
MGAEDGEFAAILGSFHLLGGWLVTDIRTIDLAISTANSGVPPSYQLVGRRP